MFGMHTSRCLFCGWARSTEASESSIEEVSCINLKPGTQAVSLAEGVDAAVAASCAVGRKHSSGFLGNFHIFTSKVEFD